jgi:protein gp37
MPLENGLDTGKGSGRAKWQIIVRNSTIGWTDDTRNFWAGCSHAMYIDRLGKTHMHPGCLNCYAEHKVDSGEFYKLGVFKDDGTGRVKHLPIWGQGDLAMRVVRKGVWSDIRSTDRSSGKSNSRRRQFCMSLGDIFEDYRGPVVDGGPAACPIRASAQAA